MIEHFSGKFEARIGLGILLLFVSVILTLFGDESTFVHVPQSNGERLLTLLPVLFYDWTQDRATCLLLTLASYGACLGILGFAALHFLERKIFEPLFFRKMIQSKLREEKLFNYYINKFKS